MTMRERFSDEHLDAVLTSVGRHLVVPEGVVLAPPVGASRATRPTARWLAVAAAACLVVVIAVGVLVAPVRDAVADWLGIGSTRVEQVPAREGDPTGLPPLSAGAVPITAADAAARLGRPLPAVTDRAIGRSARFAAPQEGGVLEAWKDGQTTLWVVPDDGETVPLMKKLVTFVDGVRPVSGLGDQALIVDGPHVLETPTRRLAARRVLLWIDDSLQFRLESDLSPDRMLEIARSVR